MAEKTDAAEGAVAAVTDENVFDLVERLGGPGDETDEQRTDREADEKAKADADEKAKLDAEAKAKADAEAKAAAEAADKAKVEGKDATANADTTKVDGVLLKDGKTIAPYGVLEGARAKAAKETERADTEANARKAAEEKADRLEAELKAAKTGAAAKTTELETQTDAELDALVVSVPEMKPLVASMKAMRTELATRREADTKRDTERQQDEQRQRGEATKTAEQTVNEAIDKNPKLAYLRDEQPELFDEAANQDRLMRESGKFKSLTLDQRFEKAVAAVEAIHGPITVSAKYQPTATPTDAEAKAKADAEAKAKADASAKDAKARAEAELKKAEGGAAFTLTDLPGGAMPGKDDRKFEDKTLGEIHVDVDRMIDKGMSPQDIINALG